MDYEDIKARAKDLFIKRDLFDTERPLVKACVITAASKMANVSNITVEEVALEELLIAFDAENDPEVLGLLGELPRELVKDTIGFEGDYTMAALAKPFYLQRRDEYNMLYTKILINHLDRQAKEEENKKQAI